MQTEFRAIVHGEYGAAEDVLRLAECLRDFARVRGFQVVHEFVDRGVSGAKESRPKLNQLVIDARQRKFDCVLVWKLDRFARSLKHLVNALAEFEALGIAFVSLRDNLDLNSLPADSCSKSSARWLNLNVALSWNG